MTFDLNGCGRIGLYMIRLTFITYPIMVVYRYAQLQDFFTIIAPVAASIWRYLTAKYLIMLKQM
jgi:hypothetical protein